MRRTQRWWCPHDILDIPKNARVGIFPLHLDPPTLQHCEIFRLLTQPTPPKHRHHHAIGSKKALHFGTANGKLTSLSAAGGSSSSSSLAEGGGSAPLRIDGSDGVVPSWIGNHLSTHHQALGRLRPAASLELLRRDILSGGSAGIAPMSSSSSSGVGSSSSSSPVAAAPLQHYEEFERILLECSLAPFDHLILVPNTKYTVTLRQSVHLAAMSLLATRELPRVHVDFKALEHPDDMMPVIYDLTQRYPNCTLVHWLPNVYEMQNWRHFDIMARQVPFLLLRPRGWKSASEEAQEQKEKALSGGSDGNTGSNSHPAGVSVTDGQGCPIVEAAAAGGGAASSFSFIADAKRQQTLMPRQWDTSHTPNTLEILEVPRMSGAFVRQELWEGNADPSTLIVPAVLRYMDSHGLYRDFRKGAFLNFRSSIGSSSTSSGGGPASPASARSNAKMPTTFSHQACVSFEGLVPRLELHYDPNNLLAREQYAKLKAFECLDGQEPDLIVPIGGDGYFMHCVRRNWRRFIPFFGVNAGHVGYLLNDCATLEELFAAPLKLHQLQMLYCEAEAETPTGEKKILSELAFNDAWLERSTGQTALIRILVNGEERIRRVRGDGVLVSTAAGSTAYAQALGASPVPVGTPLIQLVGSNIVSPPNWRPVHLNEDDCVEFESVDSSKRPCRGFVDSVDVGIVTRMLIRTSRVAGVQVAFADSCDLQHKLYKLQFPKA